MNSELLVGLIGLGGALIGAAASGWATWFTLRRTEALAERDRVRVQNTQAVDATIQAFHDIERHLRAQPERHDQDGRSAWEQRLDHELLDPVWLAMLRLRDPDLRERVKACANLIAMHEYLYDDLSWIAPGAEGTSTLQRIVGDATSCLGAYLRDEPVPPPSSAVLEAQDTLNTMFPESPPASA